MTKRPRGKGWQEPDRQLRTAAEFEAVLQDGGGLGCVHGYSGTAVLDLDAGLHLVVWALSAAGVDACGVLTTPTPATQGNRRKPPKLWFRVPEGQQLTAHKLVCNSPKGVVTVFELRAGAVQDVLPPSIHPGGYPYRWVGSVPATRQDFAHPPPDLLHMWSTWGDALTKIQEASPWEDPNKLHEKVRESLQTLQAHPIWSAAARQGLADLKGILHSAGLKPRKPGRPKQPVAQQSRSTPAKQDRWTVEEWCATWCAHVPPGQVLERNGYTPSSARTKDARELARYLAPGSTTGEPGVVVLRGDDGNARVFSHHGSDAIGRAGGALDSWGLLKLLEHAGNTAEAIAAARVELEALGVVVPEVGRHPATGSKRPNELRPQNKRPTEPKQDTGGVVGGLEVSDDQGARDTSEDGLALSLGDAWGGTVRHTPRLGMWHTWTGYRWAEDSTGYHMRSALDHLRAMARHEVVLAHAQDNPAEVRAAQKRAHVIRQARTLRAVTALSGIQGRQATAHTDWDRHPWLLATPGGTVELRTGELRPATPSDLLSQCTAVAPAPPGTVPELWVGTLHYLMGGDVDPDRAEELVAYLKRLCGYLLTGSIQEHVLAFGHGTGRNGKTLIVQTLLDLLGDYAVSIPPSVLMDQKHEQHPEHLARLMGKRLAVGSETEEGRRWAEAKIKGLTGGDRITARFMHQNSFEFAPQFKLFLVGNHRPNLRHVDMALRRRLHLIPFEVTVPESMVDPTLPAKLRREGPGILRWMIDGCLEWLARRGLHPPQAILDATEDYFAEQDTVGAWAAECCVLDPSARTPTATVWESWSRWALASGYPPGSQRTLTPHLRRLGADTHRTGGKRVIAGLRVER
jgi:P4 family phage/plasmid primase-like protien